MSVAGLLIKNLTGVTKFMLMSMGLWKIKHVNNFMSPFTKKNTLIDKRNNVNEIYVAKMILFGTSVIAFR